MLVSLFGVLFVNRCLNRWTPCHWKGQALLVQNWDNFWPTWLTTNVVIIMLIMSLSLDWMFFVKKEKQEIKSDLVQIKLPFVPLKSNFPYLVLTAVPVITSQFLQTKPFPAPGLFTLSFHQGQLGSQALLGQCKSFMSVLCFCFCSTCLCLPLSRHLLFVV